MRCNSSAVYVDLVSEALGVLHGQMAGGVVAGWCRSAIILSCFMQSSGAVDLPLRCGAMGVGALISKE